MLADGHRYVATWESSDRYVEVPGIAEIKVQGDDESGDAVLYMPWLLVNIKATGVFKPA